MADAKLIRTALALSRDECAALAECCDAVLLLGQAYRECDESDDAEAGVLFDLSGTFDRLRTSGVQPIDLRRIGEALRATVQALDDAVVAELVASGRRG